MSIMPCATLTPQIDASTAMSVPKCLAADGELEYVQHTLPEALEVASTSTCKYLATEGLLNVTDIDLRRFSRLHIVFTASPFHLRTRKDPI